MQELLAVVSLNTIRRNAACVRAAARRPLIAVVKDDAYGHGAVRVAHALDKAASAFAVATVAEGAALRVAGVSKDILVLTPPLCREEALRLLAYGLIASVSSARSLALCAQSGVARAHLAVNTGMNRYGVRPDRVRAMCRMAAGEGVTFEGIYSHLYAPRDGGALAEQKKLFAVACERLEAFFPGAVCHLPATGGVLAGVRTDAVRAGLSLYGYLPEGWEGALPVRPAMRVYATVAECRRAVGSGAGYARAPHALGQVHTLRLGYGDGFFRAGGLGAVGKLCMDACVREGAARAGRRCAVLTDAARYAAEHGTSVYEVLVNVTKRAEMKYLG